jgi:hypothetical protein
MPNRIRRSDKKTVDSLLVGGYYDDFFQITVNVRTERGTGPRDLSRMLIGRRRLARPLNVSKIDSRVVFCCVFTSIAHFLLAC